MPGAIHDSRGRAQREADRTFVALNHNRLAGLIGGHRAGSVSCGCLCCRCWFCRCRLLSRCRAGLPKSQGRNERADESDNYFVHYNASLFMLMFTPNFVAGGLGGRSHSVARPSSCLTGSVAPLFELNFQFA